MSVHAPCAKWIATAVILGVPGLATAQQAYQNRAQLPSISGPSARVGQIGGYNTRENASSLGLPNAGLSYNYGNASQYGMGAAMSAYSRNLQLGRSNNIFNPTGNVFGLPDGAGLPADIGRGATGRYISPQLRPRGNAVSNAADPNPLQYITGFTDALSQNTPLFGWKPDRIEPTPQAYFGPEYGDSAFNQFFKLKPAEESVPPPTGVTTPNIADMVKSEIDDELVQMESRALVVFKAGTLPTTEERTAQLSRAQTMLESVSRMKRDSAIAPILAAHAALMKDEIFRASRMLYLAAERDPAILSRQDLGNYFGDQKLMIESLQNQLHVGDISGDADALAVQAYCAWALGDRGRTLTTLGHLGQITGGRDTNIRRGQFRNSLAMLVNP